MFQGLYFNKVASPCSSGVISNNRFPFNNFVFIICQQSRLQSKMSFLLVIISYRKDVFLKVGKCPVNALTILIKFTCQNIFFFCVHVFFFRFNTILCSHQYNRIKFSKLNRIVSSHITQKSAASQLLSDIKSVLKHSFQLKTGQVENSEIFEIFFRVFDFGYWAKSKTRKQKNSE